MERKDSGTREIKLSFRFKPVYDYDHTWNRTVLVGYQPLQDGHHSMEEYKLKELTLEKQDANS